MDNYSVVSKQILKIVNQAVTNKIYGSIEVYFEAGKVTQVTQRIISKIQKNKQYQETNLNLLKQKHDNGQPGRVDSQNTLLTT